MLNHRELTPDVVFNLRGDRAFDTGSGKLICRPDSALTRFLAVFAVAGVLAGGVQAEAAPWRHAPAHRASHAHHRSIWAVRWAQQHPAEATTYRKAAGAHRYGQPDLYWRAGHNNRYARYGKARHGRRGHHTWMSAVVPGGNLVAVTPMYGFQGMVPPTPIMANVPAASMGPLPVSNVVASSNDADGAAAGGTIAPVVTTNVAPASAPVRVASVATDASVVSRGKLAAIAPARVGYDLEASDSPAPSVTLDFVAADINDVLKSLALQTHTNIVSGADVHGNITVSLTHVSLDEAMDLITKLSGFEYAKVGRTYVVGTPTSIQELTSGGAASTPPTVANLELRSIRFHYADKEGLEKSIHDFFPTVAVESIQMTGGSVGTVQNSQAQGQSSSATAGSGPNGATASDTTITSQNEKYLQGGGVLVVKGVKADIDAVETFVDEIDDKLIDSIANAKTAVYEIKYMSAKDLISSLNTVIPSLVVSQGPGPGFSLTAPITADAGSTSSTANYGAPTASATSATSSDGTSISTASVAGGKGNTLILMGSDPDIKRALDLLAQVDIQQPQIDYDAKITEVSLDNTNNLGLNWDFSGATTRIGELADNTNTHVDPNGPTIGDNHHAGDILKFGIFGRTAISNLANVSLDAVLNKSNTKILADPNISAVDGQQAAVFIGDTVNYVSSITQTTTGPSVTTASVNVGIKLYVAGKVSDDGYVTVNLHPEVSVISGYLAVPGGGKLPQIASREATTTVRVKDGDYIAIGGLISDQDIKAVNKVPGLGDLPFFGQLFRDNQKSDHRDEVVIFVKVSIHKGA